MLQLREHRSKQWSFWFVSELKMNTEANQADDNSNNQQYTKCESTLQNFIFYRNSISIHDKSMGFWTENV